MDSSFQAGQSPLDYSLPYNLHAAYVMPADLSQSINALSERADYLRGLWVDDYVHEMDEFGNVPLPAWLHQAARVICSNGYAIAEYAMSGRYRPEIGIHTRAAVAYQEFDIDRRISPVQILAMLAFCQFRAWFERVMCIVEKFDRSALEAGFDAHQYKDDALLQFAAEQRLDDSLMAVNEQMPDLLRHCQEVEGYAGVCNHWSHPDLYPLCQQIAAMRWLKSSPQQLPEDEEELGYVQTLMADWFAEMDRHITPASRHKAWEGSPFPVLIRGVQGVLLATRPDLVDSVGSYQAVLRLSNDGLTVIQKTALIALRQLFVTQVRNIDGNEFYRLIKQLRDLMEAVQHDTPHWIESQRRDGALVDLRLKERMLSSHRRAGGAKSIWDAEYQAWEAIAADIWRESPRCAKGKVVDLILDAYANAGYQLSSGTWQPLRSYVSNDGDTSKDRDRPSAGLVASKIGDCQPDWAKSKRGRPARTVK